MTEHLTTLQMHRYRSRKLPPTELISAGDHLAVCARCRDGLAGGDELPKAFQAFAPAHNEGEWLEADHLASDQLAGYVYGLLDNVERDVAEGHLEHCSQCTDDVFELTEIKAVLAEAPAQAPAPERRPNVWSRIVSQWRENILLLPLQAAGVLAIVLVVIGTITLRNEIGRLRTENAQVQNDNQPAEEVSESQTLDLDEGRESGMPSTLLSSGEEMALALNDGGRRVGLDKSDNLVGFERVSEAQQALVKAALKGIVGTPRFLAEMGAGAETLMGGTDGDSFRLLSPVGKVLRMEYPQFHWSALKGATSYRVTVSDSQFNPIAESGPLSTTVWTISQPLKRGVLYTWEVTALREGKEVTVPAAPAPEANFRVLDSKEHLALERAERIHAGSPLLLGVLYASAGLVEEAERKLQDVARANPRSSIPRKLLRSLRYSNQERPH